MPDKQATASAFPNIALIKYWGDRDPLLHLPANGSISFNLGGLTTRASVTFNPDLAADHLILNGQAAGGAALQRLSRFLDHVRRLAHSSTFAVVESENNFPMGAGIASSASAFAALALAASSAAGLELDERQLSRLARLGSGSACRSVPGGFVEWYAGQDEESSYAASFAPADHWELVDCVAVVSEEHKAATSTEGHLLASSSMLQGCRIYSTPERLDAVRQAILQRDFEALAPVVELDCQLMHAVMMTSTPPLFYWQPATLDIIQSVLEWRRAGLSVCYTIDAGPNVHVICLPEVSAQVQSRLSEIPGVISVLTARPAGPAALEK